MTSRTRFLVAGALAIFASSARAADDDEEKDKIPVSLAEVRAFPETYQRVPFDIQLLFHGSRNIYNPFYTTFEPSAYLNFAAWPADAPIFTREGFCDDYPFFYVDRRSLDLQRQIVAMRPFTWFEAHCIVRSSAQGRAWIEVLSLSTIGPMLDTTDLRHLVRGNVLASNGEYEHSMIEFELARLTNAPQKFVARCKGEEGRVALAANKPERAIEALEVAWRWFPEDRNVAMLLDKAATMIATGRNPQVASVPPTPAPTPPPTPKPKPKPAPAVPPDPKPVEPQTPPHEPAPTEPAPKPTPEVKAPEAKPAAKPTAKPEAKPEVKPEATPEVKPEATPEMKPEAKPEETPAPPETPAEPDPKPVDDGSKPEETPAPDPQAPEAPAPEGTPPDGTPATDPDAKPETTPPAEPTPAEPAPETPAEPATPPDDGGKPDETPPPPLPDEPTTPPDDHGGQR